MTLILAIKYRNGSVLATDTRVMYGEMKRDRARKIIPLTDEIGVASAGLNGASDDILRSVKDSCNEHHSSFDDVLTLLSDECLKWFKRNEEKLEEEDKEEGYLVHILVSPERIRMIFDKGYSEESYDYACEGSGRSNGEYILRKFYKENMEEEEAKELAAYTILETSRIDPSVGEDIQMAIFPKGNKYKIISNDEIKDIKTRLAPLSRNAMETQIKTIENIIKVREEINNLWKIIFGFKLLNQNEKAVFQITKPCRSESEFTNNIAALALLIDQLNIKEMKKTITEKGGSINILEAFLKKKIKEFPSEIIFNLREIMTLRSKRFPIHVTDSKFVEAVIRITGKYPPNWFELYSKALDKYKESLNKLLACLQEKNQ